ncbi:MAG: bifunctional precorrin-2 dehydrogenase/sirohydrochlorin ferrochelatase [Hyphomicrobiales bacterium]
MSMMIELRGEAGPALVVGGGAVATRKVRNLAEGEFRITVIAPEMSEEIRTAPFIRLEARPFADSDLPGDPRYALVFACTDDRETNRRVGELARSCGIPVVVTDSQEESTFFTPATIRDGDLAIAVSTGGASPTLAREIREKIVAALGPGWARVVALAREERRKRLEARRAAPTPTDESGE